MSLSFLLLADFFGVGAFFTGVALPLTVALVLFASFVSDTVAAASRTALPALDLFTGVFFPPAALVLRAPSRWAALVLGTARSLGVRVVEVVEALVALAFAFAVDGGFGVGAVWALSDEVPLKPAATAAAGWETKGSLTTATGDLVAAKIAFAGVFFTGVPGIM